MVYVAGPPPGSSAITAALLLLLESVSELLQKESILLDLGLKFMELLQVRTSKLCGGRDSRSMLSARQHVEVL